MFFRKKHILAVVETVYGTDPTPVAANAILTKNLNISPQQGSRVTRDLDRPSLGNDEEIAVSRYTDLSFSVELSGSGTAGDAPGFGVLLRGCAFAETLEEGVSATYELVSEAMESVTIYYYHDGELHKLTGARGTVAFDLSTGAIPVMNFNFTGLHNDPTAPTVIAPDTSGFVKPIPVTKANTPAFTVDSHAVKAQGFTLDLANEVVYRNVVNSESVQITDRAPVGNLSFEQVPIGTKNFWTIAKDGALVPVSITHGITAGNIVAISGARVQLSQPSLSDSDGISMMEMSTRWIPTDSGDDEVSVVFT